MYFVRFILFVVLALFLQETCTQYVNYGGQMEGNRGRRVGYGARIEEDRGNGRREENVGRRRGMERGGYDTQDYGILPEYEEEIRNLLFGRN